MKPKEDEPETAAKALSRALHTLHGAQEEARVAGVLRLGEALMMIQARDDAEAKSLIERDTFYGRLLALEHSPPGKLSTAPWHLADRMETWSPASDGFHVQRIRDAITDRWIVATSSQETIDALLAVDRDQLWCSLQLDDVDGSLPRLRRDLRFRSNLEREAQKNLQSFRSATAALPRTADVLSVEATLEGLLADAQLGHAMVAHFLKDALERNRPHARARWRGQKLRWLYAALRKKPVAGRPWTHRRFAQLILNSTTDFVVPPCPKLVELYSNAGPGLDGLMDTIKKQIAAVGKKTARASTRNH